MLQACMHTNVCSSRLSALPVSIQKEYEDWYAWEDAARAIHYLAVLRNIPSIPPAEKELTPVFVNFENKAWKGDALARIFHDILIAVGLTEEQASKLSMHSWRIYLACALLDAGASDATIQMMLRWRSTEALRIYARMNDATYSKWLSQASAATVSSTRTTTAAELAREAEERGAINGSAEAAVTESWLRRAARAGGIHANLVAQCPVHDADDVVAALRSDMALLHNLATGGDD